MAERPTYVIIGASLTGAVAARTLREGDPTGRIVLIGAETELPYERPPLSKGYLSGVDGREKALVHDAGWYAEHAVELRLGTPATAVDPRAHTVTLADGTTVGYDKLLLATGSRPRRLNAPGVDHAGVHFLRTLADADRLRQSLSARGRVVIVGAGWIGLETAAVARRHGCEVTVVETDHLPLRRVLGDEVAEHFVRLHRAHGVEFRFGTWVREFRGVDGELRSVLLADGAELAADVAVVAVGIEPVVELATQAGLTVADGIVTDASLRTSDPDVYAAGDVASSAHPTLGRRLRVEHWANARKGGKAAARAMLGEPVRHDELPYFFSDQYDSSPSLSMEYTGWAGPGDYDRVVFRGDHDIVDGADPQFLAFWLSGDRVLAGMNVNTWDVRPQIEALVRAGHAGRAVDPAKLVDPTVALDTLI